MQYLGQGSIMIIAGIAAGFVADLIKKKMVISSNNVKEKNDVIDLFGQQISPLIADTILKNNNELFGARKKSLRYVSRYTQVYSFCGTAST
ncbi:hypothetical protein ES705_48029 [subsurface metagenome]